MNSRESFKEMIKKLQVERMRINTIAGLLDGKTTIGGDLFFSHSARMNLIKAYNEVSAAIDNITCEYLAVNDPEFYGQLKVFPDLEVYIEEGVGVENIVIHSYDIEGNRMTTTL